MKFTTSTIFLATAVATVSAKSWNIAKDLDEGVRANLCALQIQTCQNNCGGPSEAPMAFCNETTVAWGCGCLLKTPDFETWNWPVPAADCKGSNDACVTNCNTGEGDRSGCFIKCQDTHKCNTKFAPVSYTDTADIAIVPDYVGPAVSYKGEKLGDLNDGNDRSNLDDASSSKGESDGDNKNSSSGKSSSGKNSDSSSSDATSTFKTTGLALIVVVAAAAAF
ncbi:hypothetical protein LPJ66_007315 [Kickxella alabastrina]|uniref:Uncharacterized protein n=1 Tax=Kickxella alabastrina TaxID=61397 RepID=A0ACC1IAM2_9FUNG|nr:hypothetical protein LPJ66_007315 [Kickxella alabastrina]